MAEAPPRLRDAIRELPRPAWILFAGTFANRFGSFVITFLVLYLTDLGYSPTQAGLAVSAYGAGSLAATAVGGYVADRLGRRTAIVVSMFSSAATMVALSQARALGLIIVLVGLAGLSAELYRPASSALLADLVPESRRVASFAVYRLAINLGFAAGPAVAGILAERSPLWLFLGDAITSAVFGVLALVALPEGERSARKDEVRGAATRAMLADRRFMLFMVASVLGAFVYFQSSTTFSLHVIDAGLSTATYGFLVALNGIIIVVLELPLVTVTQRVVASRAIALGSVLVGVGFALTGVATTTLALSATVFIWTLGEIVQAPVASAYVAQLAPAHLRGRYVGTWGLSWGFALMAGPAIGGALYEREPMVLWATCGVLGLVSALLVLIGDRTKVRPSLGRPEAGPELPGVET